jgi:ElaB/YqjD/DUF883 family membrane-anchored ribosome-binding protein
MSEQRLRVESGPPQQMIDDGASAHDEPGAAAQAKDKAEQVKDKAQQAAAPAKEKAREVAGEAKSHAQAAAGQAKDQAAAQVDEKSTQVGQQIGSQGEALEGVAGELRKQGKDGPAKVAEQAAEKVKGVGDYLEQADGEKLVEHAQQIARDNPAAAAAVGAAAGFAAGRVIKASLDDDESPDGAEQAAPDPAGPGTGSP